MKLEILLEKARAFQFDDTYLCEKVKGGEQFIKRFPFEQLSKMSVKEYV